MLLAGFFVHDIMRVLAWLKYLSFVFYGYTLLQKVSLETFPLQSVVVLESILTTFLPI